MSFASFLTFSLDEFLKREAAPEELWIFIHIPKTAGSSFASELSDLRRPYRNVHVNYEDKGKSYDSKLETAVDQFIEDNKATPFRACSGHITMRHVLRIRKTIPRARVVSFLRDPVERVISDFRYARTPAHPPYREFIQQFPTIESYVDSPASQNKMFKFLAPDPKIGMAELLPFLDESMSFIGLTEMYPMSFNIVMQLSGSKHLPTSHKSKTEPTEHNLVDRSPDLIKRIREANAHDIGMFTFVKERMLARREQWRAILGTATSKAGGDTPQSANQDKPNRI